MPTILRWLVHHGHIPEPQTFADVVADGRRMLGEFLDDSLTEIVRIFLSVAGTAGQDAAKRILASRNWQQIDPSLNRDLEMRLNSLAAGLPA